MIPRWDLRSFNSNQLRLMDGGHTYEATRTIQFQFQSAAINGTWSVDSKIKSDKFQFQSAAINGGTHRAAALSVHEFQFQSAAINGTADPTGPDADYEFQFQSAAINGPRRRQRDKWTDRVSIPISCD